MRVSHLKISNHRRVGDLNLDIRAHAVLVGPNAVGKTTVLRLLDATLGASWNQLVATLDVTVLRDPEKPLIVEVTLGDLSPDDLAYFADKVEVGVGAEAGQNWLTIRLAVSQSPVDPERSDISRAFVKPMVEDIPANREDLKVIGWSYLPASRSPDRDLGMGRTSAVRSLLHAIALNPAEVTALRTALESLSSTLDGSPSLAALRKTLAESLSSLYPEPVATDDLTIDLPTTTIDDPLADVDVRLRRDGSEGPLSAQSDGLRSLSVVAVQLLANDEARILAVDEPEIHLHPRSQSNLAGLLARAPGQRIVATHAPAVLAKFDPEHAIALSAAGGSQLPEAAFTGDPKRLQHWWVDGALEPLTARRVVFVEGISDRILTLAVGRLLDLHLDRNGVAVVSLNGAGNFKPALRLFGARGFGLSVLGLVDENETHIIAKALSIADSETELDAENFLVFHADLEEEYVNALGVADVVAMLVGSGLFTQTGLLTATAAPTVADISPADLSAHLRSNKVEAAAALAAGLSAAQAQSLSKLVKLLARATAP
jgi:putative ATP-dependent endonuclease of the OLD family